MNVDVCDSWLTGDWCVRCWCYQKQPSAQLERVMAEMRVDSSGDAVAADDDDLLALMDSAARQ